MIPNVFKTLKQRSLCILLIMLLIFCVQSGHADEQCLRVRGFHNKASQKYLKINTTVTADEDDFHPLFMVRRRALPNDLTVFFYDPSTKRFMCLKKFNKLMGKRIIRDRDIDDCIFQETPIGDVFTKYIVPKYNYTIAFNKHGLQSKKNTKSRHATKQRSFLLNKYKIPPDESFCNSFCNDMKKLSHTRLAAEIKEICRNRK